MTKIRKVEARVCVICGENFMGSPWKKYCSGVCQDNSRKVALVCVFCGKSFMGKKGRKTCSRTCGAFSSAKKLREAGEDRAKKAKPTQRPGAKIDDALDRVVLMAYERGDAWERQRIAALNPGLVGAFYASRWAGGGFPVETVMDEVVSGQLTIGAALPDEEAYAIMRLQPV